MTRMPSHTIDDAPEASRALLADLVQFSPTGQLLNMHAQMAHAPAVLQSYTAIRRATGQLGTLDQRMRTALMLATAAVDGNAYALAIITLLARRVFTAYFLNYAGTELDVPASPEPSAATAGQGRD